MNLFNPPQFAKGDLGDTDNKRFSITKYFSRQARSCGWVKEDIQRVVKKARGGNHANLVNTIKSHLTTNTSEVSYGGLICDEMKCLSQLRQIKTENGDNIHSKAYILVSTVIEAIESKSKFSMFGDAANPLMNYLYAHSTEELKNLILSYKSGKRLSLYDLNEFYAHFTNLITDFLLSPNGKNNCINDHAFSLAGFAKNEYYKKHY